MQQTLEEALARLTGETIGVVGSSRTDAGVHACGLCAHFDSATRIPPEKICFALNTTLPPDIRIRESMLAPEDSTRGFPLAEGVPPYILQRASRLRHRQAVQGACAHADGRGTDARGSTGEPLRPTRFRRVCRQRGVAKSTVRTIYRAQVERQGEDVVLTVLGDGFLYNMVRIIAGTLMEVGTGNASRAASRAIATGDRLLLGRPRPPAG